MVKHEGYKDSFLKEKMLKKRPVNKNCLKQKQNATEIVPLLFVVFCHHPIVKIHKNRFVFIGTGILDKEKISPPNPTYLDQWV